jgi:hypothetical protein
MVAQLDDSLQGIRDRAILLIGFAGAFRRSELASLTVDDIQFTNDGLVITLRRSKTDQEGEGYIKGIPYGSAPATCPVRALRAWLDASGSTTGSLFRSVWKGGRRLRPSALDDRAIAEVVKRAAQAAGYDATRFSGHSLRAGLVTTAAAAGVDERTIMEQTGHKTTTSVPQWCNWVRRSAYGGSQLARRPTFHTVCRCSRPLLARDSSFFDTKLCSALAAAERQSVGPQPYALSHDLCLTRLLSLAINLIRSIIAAQVYYVASPSSCCLFGWYPWMVTRVVSLLWLPDAVETSTKSAVLHRDTCSS